MPHPFVLVFRFLPESPLQSADIEDDVANALGNSDDDPTADHLVDGNEIGDGIDIFVHTRDPRTAFSMCESMLKEKRLIDTVVVAYRDSDSEAFSVIHPAGFPVEFVV